MGNTSHVYTCLSIVGVTSLRPSHALTNSKGSRRCAVDGWIANRVSRQFIFTNVWLALQCFSQRVREEILLADQGYYRTITSVLCRSDCRALERTILSISSTLV